MSCGRRISQSADWLISFLPDAAWLLAAAALVLPAHGGELATGDSRHAGLLESIDQQQLWRDPVWQRLLEFDIDAGESRVVTEDFFLAADGRVSPESELRATVGAYFAPLADPVDQHPRCRFPARYYWLAERLGPDSGIEPTADCPRLSRWGRFGSLRSVSLILVSGYFGNPASSFGHTIFRLNNGDGQQGLTLLDIGINYGALVPENEWTPLYVVRGLLGGYQAGYSDKLYYTQDLAYTRVQFRDMWEYELELPDEKLRLIVYHLWEVLGRKYQYFFLKDNCAYRLAELLELATGEDFLSHVSTWYAPVSLFHRLADIDARTNGGLIREVRWVPSSQRVLYEEFLRLTDAEREIANELIRTPAGLDTGQVRTLPPDRQDRLLEVLLAYYHYRLVGAGEEEGPAGTVALRAEKDAVLRARLALPGRSSAEIVEVPPVSSPASGSKPSQVGLGAGYNSEFDGYVWVTTSAFRYDIVGNNNLDGSELVVADLAAGYSPDEGLFIDRLDFARARKMNLNTARIEGESRWSWQLAAGLKRDSQECADCREFYGTAGLGRASAISETLIGYAMLDLSLETDGSPVVIRPNVGLRLDPDGHWVTRAEVAWEQGRDSDESRTTFLLESRYSLTTNNEIRFGLVRREATEMTLSLQHDW